MQTYFARRELDSQFDLVLILERFDESLVVLQDLICWPTEDLVYLKQNERTSKGGFSQSLLFAISKFKSFCINESYFDAFWRCQNLNK